MRLPQNILPDSRLSNGQSLKGVVRGVVNDIPENWVPIWCASCGKAEGGYVMQKYATFACYLCQPCADKYGEIAGHYMTPDQEYWQRVAELELEEYGKTLGPQELIKALDEVNSPLAKIARERLVNKGD